MIKSVLHAPFGSAVRLILTGSDNKALDNDQRSVFLDMRSEISRVEIAEWRQADFESRPGELKKNEAVRLEQWMQKKPDWFISFKKLRTQLGRSITGEEETHYYLPDIFEFICAYIKDGNTAPPVDTSYIGELLNLVDEPRLEKLLAIVELLQSLQATGLKNKWSLKKELQTLRKEYAAMVRHEEERRLEAKAGEFGMNAKQYMDMLDLAKRSSAEMDIILKKSGVEVQKVKALTPKLKQQFLIALIEVGNREWDRLAIPEGYLGTFRRELFKSYGGLFPEKNKKWWETLSDANLMRSENAEYYSDLTKSLKS